MHRKQREQGSALIIALVVVILIMGIGGAFMSESVFRSKTQLRAMEADKALLMCDAGLERARRALYTYRVSNTWTWDQILTYCKGVSTDAKAIKADFLQNVTASAYTAYRSSLGDGNDSKELTLNNKDSVLPANKEAPSAGDAAAGVPFGANFPFLSGALHIKVHDNNDVDGTDGGGNPIYDPLKDSDNKVLVTVTATLQDGTQRQIEGHIEFVVVKMTVNGLAAVVSKDDVAMNGTITIDGRDWNIDGTALNASTPDGVFGIVAEASINPEASSAIGGNGIAPGKKGYDPATISPKHTFPGGYPPDPDAAVGFKKGQLKSLAQSGGGYFATEASYDAYLKANGGELPGGKIYYLEFDPSSSFSVGDYKKPKVYNSDPSILVVHNDAGTTSIKNLHGGFKGLLLADSIVHVNANTELLGMVQVFSPTASKDGNVFGNGGANIKFSSEALSKLPAANPESCKLLSWRKILH